MKSELKIYLVDDDSEVRKTLARTLRFNDYEVEEYDSGNAFLDSAEMDGYGCIILDVAMPGMSGLEVQTELASRGCLKPVVFMTGHGDVPTSVRALKNGAIEFLEKPFPVNLMLERVVEALAIEEQRLAVDTANKEILENFKLLTKREADVMASLSAGHADLSNKEVARELDISHRTVEEYRSRIMQKMNANSITHLVEMAKVCGVYRS